MFYSILLIVQVISAVVLIGIIMSTTTKHEGMGATIGGKASSSFKGRGGFEDQLQKYTLYAAVAFFTISLLVAYFPH
jgi:preprotein translocase subunit SecG